MRLFHSASVRSGGGKLGRIKTTVRGFKMPKMSSMKPSIKMPRMGKSGRTKI